MKIGDGLKRGDKRIRHCTCPDCRVTRAKMRALHRSARRREAREARTIVQEALALDLE